MEVKQIAELVHQIVVLTFVISAVSLVLLVALFSWLDRRSKVIEECPYPQGQCSLCNIRMNM